METKNQNGIARPTNNNGNGATKETLVLSAKPTPTETKPAIVDKPLQELATQQRAPEPNSSQSPSELTLDVRLKMVSDLHRRSTQRTNLISRMRQLESFEIALAQGNDELEDNPYQGCKLIIRDDQNREFVTTTPGLIRMTAQYIFLACEKKLREIESSIIFPRG